MKTKISQLITLLCILSAFTSAQAQNNPNTPPATVVAPSTTGAPNGQGVPPSIQIDQVTKVNPNKWLTIGSYETISVTPASPFGFINSVVITTRGRGSIEILVNGRSKGYLTSKHVLWKTSSIIQVKEYATSIEFRHDRGFDVKIKQIVVQPVPFSVCNSYYSPGGIGCDSGLGYPPVGPGPVICAPMTNCGIGIYGSVAGLSNLYRNFSMAVSGTEIERNLGPVKVAASKAIASCSAGQTSSQCRADATATLQAYDVAMPYVAGLSIVPSLTRTVQMWQNYGEALRAALR